ncbi:hypothetical protein [Catenulispora subtropica]
MSKSGKKNETESTHVAKSDVRHKFQVVELDDFTRRETRPDGTEKMMPRIAVLNPVGGGKHVRAYVPGNLDGPLEPGSVVMCRPHDKQQGDGPPVKFRITNVVEGHASETMTPTQNAEFGERAAARPQTQATQRQQHAMERQQQPMDRQQQHQQPMERQQAAGVGAGAPAKPKPKAKQPRHERQQAGVQK